MQASRQQRGPSSWRIRVFVGRDGHGRVSSQLDLQRVTALVPRRVGGEQVLSIRRAAALAATSRFPPEGPAYEATAAGRAAAPLAHRSR